MGYKQPPRVLREVLDACNDYQCAFAKLSTETMVAPTYIALTGVKGDEGVIITRDRTRTLNATYISDENWNLVQTNDETFSGQCRERCLAARTELGKLTRSGVNSSSVFDKVLNVEPNLNSLSVYASIMIPSQGLFLT